MIKTRREAGANYSAVFINGKTIRIPINPKEPILELRYPEFYDISPGNKCSGNCNGQLINGTPTTACYAAATKTGVHYTNLAEKVERFFGALSVNQRPFQVAIGGEQEPLENPEIWEMIEKFKELGIVPNYTTNGIFVTDSVVEKTIKHCGGVAVTLHPHLEKFWRRALTRFAEAKVKLNVHVIVSGKESIDLIAARYKEFVNTGLVDYFVLLPWMPYGHAKNMTQAIDYVYLKQWVDLVYKEGKIAFGANFYNFLKKYGSEYGVSLYPPEILSKYLVMNNKLEVCNNSFDRKVINYNPGTGCELGHARSEFLEIS